MKTEKRNLTSEVPRPQSDWLTMPLSGPGEMGTGASNTQQDRRHTTPHKSNGRPSAHGPGMAGAIAHPVTVLIKLAEGQKLEPPEAGH